LEGSRIDWSVNSRDATSHAAPAFAPAALGRGGGDGAPVGWNLVAGISDGPRCSERSVWAAGGARAVQPVRFADDLSAVTFAGGERLRFAAEAVGHVATGCSSSSRTTASRSGRSRARCRASARSTAAWA
jgi:hypothetical protein